MGIAVISTSGGASDITDLTGIDITGAVAGAVLVSDGSDVVDTVNVLIDDAASKVTFPATGASLESVPGITVLEAVTDLLQLLGGDGISIYVGPGDGDVAITGDNIVLVAATKVDVNANIDMSGFTITSLADGVDPTDAATVGQLVAYSIGLTAFKEPARFGTTADVPLSGLGVQAGGDWSVTLDDGDRIAVLNQAILSDNGIYVASAGSWNRAADFVNAYIVAGAYFEIKEGDTLADTIWMLATDDPIDPGVTDLTFIPMPTLNDLVAGYGLSKSGYTLSINLSAGSALISDAFGLRIDTTIVPRKGVPNTYTQQNTFSDNLIANGNFNSTYLAEFTGSITVPPETTKTAAYDVDLTANIVVPVDTTGGAVTISLPEFPPEGAEVEIVDVGGNALVDNITIDTYGATLINGAASTGIATNYGCVKIRAIGGNYFVVARAI